jgi:hypothetical protein
MSVDLGFHSFTVHVHLTPCSLVTFGSHSKEEVVLPSLRKLADSCLRGTIACLS